jgi:transcriptional regulator with XRE-family HTH domain
MENFGEKLKRLREERNLSQKELGDKMGGITQQTIAQYEKKETVPKLETVSKIADALEINPNIFYSDFSQSVADDSGGIGEKIKAVRLQKGVSQAALAKCLGVSTAMICQYEVGKRKPKVETLSKIAGALGVDLKVFYDDLPQKTMELKRYENIALVNEFENACFRLVNFPDSEEITEKYEKLRKKLIDRLSCM